MSNNYKSIAKGNALFGGVQIYNIILGVLRNKVVAVLLGPEGMGIMGLLNSSLDIVRNTTNFGLTTSAVREVSIANASNDATKVDTVNSVITKIVWLTGFLGTAICFIFAKQLSIWSFDNDEYTIHLRILSVVLLVAQLTEANKIMLQGLRKLKELAKCNIIGNTLATITVLPLYYFFGFRGIVPAIFAIYIISYIVSSYYYRGLKIRTTDLSLKETFVKGKTMMTLGFMLCFTDILESATTYIIKIFISNSGGVSEVGFYNAGFAMILGYVGLVFKAIGTDYFPRLASVSNDKEKFNEVINDQMEIMVLALLPLVGVFIALSPLLIRVLYTDEFLCISNMINIMAVGMIMRAISWCPGFMYMARGDSKLYLIIYIITAIVSLILYFVFYSLFGLTGIGVAFLMSYVLGNPATFLITKHFYGYRLRKETLVLISISLLFAFLTLLFTFVTSLYLSYLGLFVCAAVCCLYSFSQLNKRLDLIAFLKSKFSK